jgi:hypothetical protein
MMSEGEARQMMAVKQISKPMPAQHVRHQMMKIQRKKSVKMN